MCTQNTGEEDTVVANYIKKQKKQEKKKKSCENQNYRMFAINEAADTKTMNINIDRRESPRDCPGPDHSLPNPHPLHPHPHRRLLLPGWRNRPANIRNDNQSDSR